MRWVAIDWSGRLVGERAHIWTAVADAAGVHELRAGRTRGEVTRWLIEEGERDAELVVGLDFAFGVPAWFLDKLGLAGAPELWAHATDEAERWLAECAPPFWGKPGRPRPPGHDGLRETERGLKAKSVFQIGGAGAVGTGSLRGWPTLLALRHAGWSIWPFEPEHRRPLALEVYPRVCTGPVVKSNWSARAAWLDQHAPDLDRHHRDDAIASEDAFDSLATVLAMRRSNLTDPAMPAYALARREGWVWLP